MGFGPVAVPQPPVLLEAVAVLPVRDLDAGHGVLHVRLASPSTAASTTTPSSFSGDCWLHLRAATAELATPPNDEVNPAGAYLFVADAHALYAHCGAAGINTINQPEEKPWNVLEFAVGDPDGNLLRFGQRLP